MPEDWILSRWLGPGSKWIPLAWHKCKSPKGRWPVNIDSKCPDCGTPVPQEVQDLALLIGAKNLPTEYEARNVEGVKVKYEACDR